MKKISILILMVMFSLFSVNECLAQHRIEQQKSEQESKQEAKQETRQLLKVDDRTWNTSEEEALNKKKKLETPKKPKETVIIIKEDKTVEIEEPVTKTSSIEINNPCFEDMSVELVSLQGNRSSQKVTITIAFTNHQINKTVYIKNFDAYNEEGDHFSTWSIGSFTTLTDIKQKTSWEVGQMLPSKNSKLTAISFRIDDCTIEMRNLPIDWR